MPSQKLILIKHSAPLIDPRRPPETWRLSEKGRALCAPLADAIAPHQPSIIISSEEPKARETGELVATKLSVPHETAPGLHEHDRSNVPHMRSGEFISMIELMLRKPDELVLGRETADEARSRFSNAVRNVIESKPDSSVAIVSHGTVIALFLAEHGAGKAFDLWRGLGLPAFAVLSLPEMKVETIVERIEPPQL
jgi:broad specificity phosphatase PhoE